MLLPDCYKAVPVESHGDPISAHVELARWLSDQERRTGIRPVTLFHHVIEYPKFPVLGNPCPTEVLLAAMGLSPVDWMEQLDGRLRQNAAPGTCARPGRWTTLSGLDEVPVIQHRPRDAGRYITAGVCVTHSVAGDINLGIYRVQVVDNAKARIFFDPRTDAHRNWLEATADGGSLPATIFLGTNPALLLAGASRLPQAGDDFDLASRLLGRELELDPELGVPADSTFVIQGMVETATEEEGPFGEFKGYYAPPRMSPVFSINQVLVAEGAFYPTIVTGAASGLSLMALQNEYLMFSHLRSAGYKVDDVSYPLSTRSEFLVLISSPDYSRELLCDAMDFDARAKIVACGDVSDLPLALASHGFSSETQRRHASRERELSTRVPRAWHWTSSTARTRTVPAA